MELIKSVGSLINSARKNFALTLVLAITYCWPLCWLRLQTAGVLLLQSNVSSYLLQKPKRISKSVNGCEKFISVLSYLVIDVQTAKALPHYYFLQFSSWLKNRRCIFNLFLFFFFFFSFFDPVFLNFPINSCCDIGVGKIFPSLEWEKQRPIIGNRSVDSR